MTATHRILYIDPNLELIDVIESMLQQFIHDLEVVHTGDDRQGLKIGLTEAFDLIILDITQIGTNGFELIEQFRAAPQSQNTPILVFTARCEVDAKVKAFECGADDYLTKPTTAYEMINSVRKMLKIEE